MITVKTAMTFDRVRAAPVDADNDNVTDDEQPLLEYLDAAVESGIFKSFDGRIFDFRIPITFASQRVVAALKRRYECGGWQIGSFLCRNDADEVVSYQLVFSPTTSVGTADEVSPATVPSVITSLRSAVNAAVRRSKPAVCLISDVPGWAFDQNMRDMAEYLSEHFRFHYFYTENWFKGERPHWDDYDIIYEAYHRNPQMGIPMSRALGALRSEWFSPEFPSPPTQADVALVNSYRAFQVAVQRNFTELKPQCPHVVYLTNPVNTQRFMPSQCNQIVASWNGNAGHKSPDGRYIKHFYDIVVPACLRAKVSFVAAEYGTKEGPMRRRTSAEMPAFYQQASVALCASEYEAASNSVMEGMSSGLALIATDVGNHREIRDAQLAHFGDTGIVLVERDVDAFADALGSLTIARVKEMGAINRKEIELRWSWSCWVSRYQAFLKEALS